MEVQKIADGEYKFAELVWENEPINSTVLMKLALERLGWKKATSYTVLRKLCEKGILKNENATVTAIIKKDEVRKQESEALLYKSFDNSLPEFVAAFLKDRKLSPKEAEELKKMIDEASRRV
jgi:BlaI family transcriptional regulator, penicillinase repressor